MCRNSAADILTFISGGCTLISFTKGAFIKNGSADGNIYLRRNNQARKHHAEFLYEALKDRV